MFDRRVLASGSVAVFDDVDGRVFFIGSVEGADEAQFGSDDPWLPTCSICDALGHGYVGAGFCPLEDVDYSDEPWWAL
jgi:hypothetical protein